MVNDKNTVKKHIVNRKLLLQQKRHNHIIARLKDKKRQAELADTDKQIQDLKKESWKSSSKLSTKCVSKINKHLILSTKIRKQNKKKQTQLPTNDFIAEQIMDYYLSLQQQVKRLMEKRAKKTKIVNKNKYKNKNSKQTKYVETKKAKKFQFKPQKVRFQRKTTANDDILQEMLISLYNKQNKDNKYFGDKPTNNVESAINKGDLSHNKLKPIQDKKNYNRKTEDIVNTSTYKSPNQFEYDSDDKYDDIKLIQINNSDIEPTRQKEFIVKNS